MRHTLVHETLPDIAVGRRVGGRLARNLGFFELTLATVEEQIIGVACAHDAGAGKRQRNAGGINGDPAAAPLLGDVSGCAGTTGGVEDEVSGVSRHEDTTLNHLGAGL